MSRNPDVSVVMAVYNGEAGLSKSLDSVLSQEGCDLEIIVVDDGSFDRTPKILDDYSRCDPRLRVIRQENTGLTRALIRGCEAAQGEFIARLDVGDIALPGRLARQVATMREDAGIAFVSCASRFVEPGGGLLYVQRGSGKAGTAIDIIDADHPHGVVDGPSAHASVMFRKDNYQSAGGYRKEFYFGQDWDLWYRLAQIGKFAMLPDVFLQIELGMDNISLRHRPLQMQYARLSLEALRLRLAGHSDAQALLAAEKLRQRPRPHAGRLVESAGCYFIGACLRRNGDVAAARKYFLRALQKNPANVKAWIRLFQTLLRGAP